MRENLFVILGKTKTIGTKYEFKVISYNLLNLEGLVYEYGFSVRFVYPWVKERKKMAEALQGNLYLEPKCVTQQRKNV